MGYRIVVLSGENQTLGTGNVLMAFNTAAAVTTAAGIVTVKRLEISQSGTATLAMIRGEMATRTTAGTFTTPSKAPVNVSPIGGSTPALAGSTTVAATASSSGITSTADTTGTYTSVYPFNFANTAGYLWKPAPDEEIIVPAA